MKAKKYIQLPKSYISYSQFMLWKNSPKKYAQMYFDERDELRTQNKGQEYGKVVADALEKGVETGDLLTDAATLLLPKYDVADQEIMTEMQTKAGWLSIIGKPDSLDSVSKRFLEFKTGKVPWTQSKAQNHPQMRFYAMVIYLAYGVLLKDADLIWIETSYEGEYPNQVITPTGHVESFTVTFTKKDLFDTMAAVSTVAKEIAIAYAAHEKDPRLEW